MITYIYLVKCPNCEDEHFDFFDDAKSHAMGCLSQKPIITQTEINRNDFGECTDHCDLGTVWSWEDVVGKETDAEPETSVFTKDDFAAFEGDYNPENDPEFYEMDNSVDYEPETSEVSSVERKPIPEGMTIEQLVEEMEENEDTVECTLCNDLFDKSECRKELNLGWLCRRCADDLVARGEGPVFKEDNYWDFLDKDTEKPTDVDDTKTPHDLGNTYDGGYPAGSDDVELDFEIEEDLEEGIFDKFKKQSWTIKCNFENIKFYTGEIAAKQFGWNLDKTIRRYKVSNFEEAAPLYTKGGLTPKFRFKTTDSELDKIESALLNDFDSLLTNAARNNSEAKRYFGSQNPISQTNIKNNFSDAIKIAPSSPTFDGNF